MNTGTQSPTTIQGGPLDERPRSSLAHLLRLWFGLDLPVGRLAYALTGCGLMLFKYGVDASVIYIVTGRFFSPVDYLNPSLSVRQFIFSGPFLLPDASWLPWVLAAWTLPFFWVGISMSVRRAVNAGRSPWAGMLFLIPLVNYVAMIILCFLPTQTAGRWSHSPLSLTNAPSPETTPEDIANPAADERTKSALSSILLGGLVALAMLGLSVYLLGSYGATLFFATPLMITATSAYWYNRGHSRSYASTFAVSLLSLALPICFMLLFALEGLICVVMAIPIALAVGAFGALVGRAIALNSSAPASHAAVAVFLLPLLAGVETAVVSPPLYEVLTTIEIDAPPERVWPHVIGYSALPEPEQWFFRAGIAYPRQVYLQGSGVGATRYCAFSTGAYVEPITVWEPPYRLAFDVVEQPPAMRELSPYDHVHAPHLNQTPRNRRGEFRLLRLPGNRTRLEGRTWYEIEMYPQGYWTLWSDAFARSIHERVFRHLKQLSEKDGG